MQMFISQTIPLEWSTLFIFLVLKALHFQSRSLRARKRRRSLLSDGEEESDDDDDSDFEPYPK